MKDIVLSVIVITYGQEKYISQALDSILCQKTQYEYEVLVGEDASPDNTRNILKEYEKKYPDIFTMIYRDVNAGGQGAENCKDLIRRARGRYICFLEGDDFWTCDTKVEEQVAFLEQHEEYNAISCNTLIVDQNSLCTKEKYPECKDDEYTLKHFRRNILPGQTACLIYRTDVFRRIMQDRIWDSNPNPGDRVLYLGMASLGKVFCIQKTMSAYRHITNEGASYSANNKRDFSTEIEWCIQLIEFARRINSIESEVTAEARFFAVLCIEGLLKKKINLRDFFFMLRNIKHKMRVLVVKSMDFVVKLC